MSFWPECIVHPFSVIPAEASECEWSCWNLWQFVQEVPHLFFDYFIADFLVVFMEIHVRFVHFSTSYPLRNFFER